MLSRVEGMPPETPRRRRDVRRRRVRRLRRQRRRRRARCERRAPGRPLGRAPLRHGRRVGRARSRPTTRSPRWPRSSTTPCARVPSASRRRSSTCTSPTTGGPVPSNLAAPEELIALGGCARPSFPVGAIEFISRTNLEGHSTTTTARSCWRCAAASGKPMNINPVQPLPTQPDTWRRRHRVRRGGAARGARVYPQSATQQLQVFFALVRHVPLRRDARVPRRLDPAARRATRSAWSKPRCATRCAHSGPTPPAATSCSAGGTSRSHAPITIPSGSVSGCPSSARSSSAGDDLDAFLDASLAEDLNARVHARRLGRGRRRAADPVTAAIVAHTRSPSPAAATPARTSLPIAVSTTRRGCSPSTCPTRSRSSRRSRG